MTTDRRATQGPSSQGRAAKTSLRGEGWYYLVVTALVFAGALVREVNLLLILAGFLVGPPLFNLLAVFRSLRKVRVRRQVPKSICAGDLLMVHLELTTPEARGARWALAVGDQIVRSERAHSDGIRFDKAHADGPRSDGPPSQAVPPECLATEVFFTHLPAGESRAEAYRARLVQRGRYQLGPLTVSTGFPFGLVHRTVNLGQTDSVFVFPRLGRLTPAWRARHHASPEGTSHRRQRHSRTTGDMYGVRQWQQGDSRRWIHWRSSARHDLLVVRQFEEPRSRDLAIVLDLYLPDQPTQADRDAVELAVSFAATVLADICRQGGNMFELAIASAESARMGGVASLHLMTEAMEHLALARATSQPPLADLLDQTLARIAPDTEVIVVSSRADVRRAGGLHLGRTASRNGASIRWIDTAGKDLEPWFSP